MHKRSKRPNRRSLSALLLASLAAIVVLLALPLTSLADLSLGSTVGGLVNGATSTVQTTVQNAVSATPVAGAGSGQSGAATSGASSAPARAVHHAAAVSSPAASAPASAPAAAPAQSSAGYTPPMYGTNPNGQGTVSSVALNPSPNVPYSYSPGGSPGEVVVLGRGRSEQQSNGSYDAHTTIVALLGTELLGVNATQGQSNTGPLQGLQNVLDSICSNTNEAVCLTLLAADTSASSNGASTHFAAANLSSQQIAGLNASAASSDSGISQSGSCQSAYGDSSLANVALASGPVASVGQSGESSNACAGQTPTQSASSSVIGLGGNGVPLPAPGCANGTPNTAFTPLAPLAAIYCNADSTSQASAPAGVREALTVLGLQTGATSLARVTTAASQSHAVAPSTATTTPGSGTTGVTPATGTTGNAGQGSGSRSGRGNGSGNGRSGSGSGNGNGNGTSGACTAGTACAASSTGAPQVSGPNRFAGQITATKSSSSLPFTGQNVLEVILVGLALLGGGLALSLRRRALVPFGKRL